jgi:Tol biopolymer transport system component
MRTQRVLIPLAIAGALLSPLAAQDLDVQLQRTVQQETVTGDLKAAIQEYKKIAANARGNRAVAAKALVHMAECYQKMGDAEARKIYEQVVKEYGDQKDAVAVAKVRLGESHQQARGIVEQQVWTTDKDFVDARPSPDGRELVFVDWLSGGNLAIRSLAGGDERAVTRRKDGSFAESPVFTPDGKRILYGWYDAPEDKWSLRLIDVDGSNDRVFPFDGYPGSVSPDSKMAAVRLTQNNAQQIAALDLQSGRVTVLKSVEWRTPQIGNFSPDGRRFVYSVLIKQDSRDREIYSMAIDGSSETKLVAAPGANENPFYTPDGAHVVFTSDRSGHWDLWSVKASPLDSHANPELIQADVGQVTNKGFSRDGALFLQQSLEQADAFTARLDTAAWTVVGAPKRVSEANVGSSGTPIWSADGKSIVYAVNRTRAARYDGSDITYVIRNTESGQHREFSRHVLSAFFPKFMRWFPGGNELLLPSWRISPVRDRVFERLDVQTGKSEVLFHAPWSNNLNTIISPDGRSVYYASYAENDPGMKQLVRRDLSTGKEEVVFSLRGASGPATLHGLSGSPDGKQVAFFQAVVEGKTLVGWSLWVGTLSGGEARNIGRPKGSWVIPNWSAWTPDGKGVLVVAGDDNSYFGRNRIWYVPLDGADPRPTGIAMGHIESLSFDPTGKFVGFTGGTGSVRIWEVKNLFSAAPVAATARR